MDLLGVVQLLPKPDVLSAQGIESDFIGLTRVL